MVLGIIRLLVTLIFVITLGYHTTLSNVDFCHYTFNMSFYDVTYFDLIRAVNRGATRENAIIIA